MNVWTGGPNEVSALKSAFQSAGFKNVRAWGMDGGKIIEDLPGTGTMLEATR